MSDTNKLHELMALMIWTQRHHLPGPIIRIEQRDREAFKKSLEYNEQAVRVNIEDRKGATLIHLTDDNGDQIVFTESEEFDLDKKLAADRLRMIKQNASSVAAQIRSDIANGVMSNDTLMEACNALDALGRA